MFMMNFYNLIQMTYTSFSKTADTKIYMIKTEPQKLLFTLHYNKEDKTKRKQLLRASAKRIKKRRKGIPLEVNIVQYQDDERECRTKIFDTARNKN